MSKKKFPKTLYVKVANEGEEGEYLEASDKYGMHAETDGTINVAVYELKAVRKLVNKSELVD